VSQTFKITITPEVTVDCFLGTYSAVEVAIGATASSDVTEASSETVCVENAEYSFLLEGGGALPAFASVSGS